MRPCQGRDREFESRRVRQENNPLVFTGLFFYTLLSRAVDSTVGFSLPYPRSAIFNRHLSSSVSILVMVVINQFTYR